MKAQTVTVVGGGTMGHGIAQVAAQSGFRTALFDVQASIAENGCERIRENLAKGVAKGKLTADEADAAFARVRRTS